MPVVGLAPRKPGRGDTPWLWRELGIEAPRRRAGLVETLFKRKVSSVTFGEMTSSASLLSAFDVDRIATEALLLQAGYLMRRRRE